MKVIGPCLEIVFNIRFSNYFLEDLAGCVGGCGEWTVQTGDTMTYKHQHSHLNPKVNILSPFDQSEVKKLWYDYRMEDSALPSSVFSPEDDAWMNEMAIAAET